MSVDGDAVANARANVAQLASLGELKVQLAAAAAGQASTVGALTVTRGPAPPSSSEALLNEHVHDSTVPGYWTRLATNAATWAREVSGQPFWVSLQAEADKWSREYFNRTGHALRTTAKVADFEGKGEERIREKVLSEVARAKAKGKPKLSHLYPDGTSVPTVNDLVRVRLQTTFLDGVDFLAEKLRAHLAEHRIEADKAAESRFSGYYAMHLYFPYEVLYRPSNVKASITCEIQIATELATTIWHRTHATYEYARTSNADTRAWQWQSEDERFIAAQLAHMIHLADGLVVQLRDAVRKRKGELK